MKLSEDIEKIRNLLPDTIVWDFELKPSTERVTLLKVLSDIAKEAERIQREIQLEALEGKRKWLTEWIESYKDIAERNALAEDPDESADYLLSIIKEALE